MAEGTRFRIQDSRVRGLGFRIQDSRVRSLGFRIQDSRVGSLGFRIQDSRVRGLGFRIRDSRVRGLWGHLIEELYALAHVLFASRHHNLSECIAIQGPKHTVLSTPDRHKHCLRLGFRV
jgi:hypothetical protein